MKNLTLFSENSERYDKWYENHYDLFLAELAAIEKVMPQHKNGIEIGIGTGRFAAPLGIKYGIDPVPEMLKKAAERGIDTKEGFAENLPYADHFFDYALMTTTLCFLDNIDKAFEEVARVLETECLFTVAFIDRNSQLGKDYKNKKKEGSFYSNVNFCSPDDIILKMENAGFVIKEKYQALLPYTDVPFQPVPGTGDGAFVVINGKNCR